MKFKQFKLEKNSKDRLFKFIEKSSNPATFLVTEYLYFQLLLPPFPSVLLFFIQWWFRSLSCLLEHQQRGVSGSFWPEVPEVCWENCVGPCLQSA